MTINYPETIAKLDAILKRGLCIGIGSPDCQVCIQAAVRMALGLPHGDVVDPAANAVQDYMLNLNDCTWSSPQARASGLRDLSIAQIGSKGVVGDQSYRRLLGEKTIKNLIPALFREVFQDAKCLEAADRCEKEGTEEAAMMALRAVREVEEVSAVFSIKVERAAFAAKVAQEQATWEWAGGGAVAANWAALATRNDEEMLTPSDDKYLLLSAKLALETLRELKSPGCEFV